MARIRGIEDVSVQVKDILRRGIPWRALEVTLKLNREAYASIGDLYLFASVFERFLGGFVTENSMIRLIVEDCAGAFKYAWDSRPGEQLLF